MFHQSVDDLAESMLPAVIRLTPSFSVSIRITAFVVFRDGVRTKGIVLRLDDLLTIDLNFDCAQRTYVDSNRHRALDTSV